MIEIELDGKKVEVVEGSMIMHAADNAGTYIPHFCYHKKLSIAANCRMCLVDVEKAPKPMPACATPVTQGMIVRTKSPKALQAQKGVMEFLLINHPLDCPICDQGGECDLQDQAMAYGRGTSRFDENKRAVEDKYMGPVIKTAMTRCIQCTRCIRFADEVAGTPEIGMLYRGEDSQITAYLEKALTSELSGNLADICPVGALLQRPTSFELRPWELKKVPAIDVMDAVGSSIRLDVRQRQVMRVLPRINEDVNEEWISDKTRHHVDALVRGRLDRPWVREKGKLREAGWPEALALFAEKFKSAGAKVAAIAGDLVDAETMYAAKALLAGQGSALLEGRQAGLDYDVTSIAAVAFNSTIAGIETAEAQMQLLSGLPPDLALKFLLSALDDAAEGPALVERMVGLWQSANTDGLASVVTGRLLSHGRIACIAAPMPVLAASSSNCARRFGGSKSVSLCAGSRPIEIIIVCIAAGSSGSTASNQHSRASSKARRIAGLSHVTPGRSMCTLPRI